MLSEELTLIDKLKRRIDATLKIYLEHSVGIGEHPQHIDEIDKLIEKIATAEEKLKTLQEFKLWKKQKQK